MGALRRVDSSLLVIPSFSRHPDCLIWARQRLEQVFGPVALSSDIFAFNHTKYYDLEMGSGLQKVLFSFRDLVASDSLAHMKTQTNILEEEATKSGLFEGTRPVNLDPGLLQLGKFMLATTKDQSHRIYLRDGIYAEVTLRFRDGAYEPWPWTYADYREPFVRDFLKKSRNYFRERLNEYHASSTQREQP